MIQPRLETRNPLHHEYEATTGGDVSLLQIQNKDLSMVLWETLYIEISIQVDFNKGLTSVWSTCFALCLDELACARLSSTQEEFMVSQMGPLHD